MIFLSNMNYTEEFLLKNNIKTISLITQPEMTSVLVIKMIDNSYHRYVMIGDNNQAEEIQYIINEFIRKRNNKLRKNKIIQISNERS